MPDNTELPPLEPTLEEQIRATGIWQNRPAKEDQWRKRTIRGTSFQLCREHQLLAKTAECERLKKQVAALTITPEQLSEPLTHGRNCPAWTNAGGFEVGSKQMSEQKEFCFIPWLEVFDGESLIARFNQHKVEHILYQRGR
jgi:hypothetical protein